ncbi:agmatinase [Leucobacter sp. M11]|uniref:agmatinase n=1 Tax=Leucobacter sp. M11 TaxID=2993565 RepID=UPI002D80AE61|nr:agmatinase [Leucobacter sp. M11]MEB4613356.1 agmatinase [Leucobacter sp. M11]
MTEPTPRHPNADPRAAAAIVPPLDGQLVPRYAGWLSFARLPRIEDVARHDISVLGVPFDAGVTYRPGARFGPEAIRQASRLLKPYNPAQDTNPYADLQIVDAGDVSANPFDIPTALAEIQRDVTALTQGNRPILVLGGDHTIALPVLRALAEQHGPVALVHFDAHLDTWGTYFGADTTHGTPFRRASEEGLIDHTRSVHVGIRGSLYSPEDLSDDAALGYTIIHCRDFVRQGIDQILDRLLDRVGEGPVYISIDIDVLDPAFAPGTGTPEAGGMQSRELLELLRGMNHLPIVGADIVEVAPAYDHAQVTAVAAANLGSELLAMFAKTRAPGAPHRP